MPDVADAVPIQKENARRNNPASFFISLFPPDPSREPSNLVNLALNQAADFVHSSKSMGNTQKVFDKGNTLVL